MVITIMRGIPGSRKSTWVKENLPKAVVVSADSYFMVDGRYQYDASKIAQAHAHCLRGFAMMVAGPPQSLPHDLVVDNTNITVAELAPYVALGKAWGHEVRIVQMKCLSAEMQPNDHGVPFYIVQSMSTALATEKLPSWWPQPTIIEWSPR